MKDITIQHGGENIPACIAGEDKSFTKAVIMVHEVWGLNQNMRSLADRMAGEGYLALAPDLIVQTGITQKIDQSIMAEIQNPATRDEAQKKLREAMAPMQAPDFGKETIERLKACYNYLKNEYHVEKISIMGFCFGGTYSFALAGQDDVELACALPFYGHAPEDEAELAKINCPIYAFYGEKDTRLTDGVPKLVEMMEKLGKDFEYKIYPGAGHAFMNDTNSNTYYEPAATDAWKEALVFLAAHM